MSFLFAVLLVAAPVEADVHTMAPGVKVWLPPPANAWGKGFNFEEYKTLLQMDADLHRARQELKLVESLKLNYTLILTEKDRLIGLYKDDISIQTIRSDRVEGNWKKCEEDLVEASGGDWWPWVIAGAGAAIGIVGVSLFLGSQIK